MSGLLLVLSSCLLVLPAAAAELEEPAPARALADLFHREWDYLMEQNPTWASRLGDRRWNDRWEDIALDNLGRQQARRLRVLEELRRIPPARLSARDRLNYELFRRQYETEAEEFRYQWHLIALNQREGIQTSDELADALRFETRKDYEDWIARLEAFPVYLDQTLALLREGIRARLLLPRIIIRRVPGQVEKQIVAEPDASPFYKAFRQFPDGMAPEEQARFRQTAREAIARKIVPAFRRMKEFLEREYLPACPEPAGIWQLPRGAELYAFFARKFTTTPMAPAEIHELGLREVKRIRGEMEQIRKKVGFEGTLRDFFHFLRTDRQFYYSDPETLLTAYQALSKRIDPLMVRLFKTLPRIPYGVEPIPDKIAPDTTTAYYRQPAADGSRAGTFFVNLYRPETRPKYEMMALSLHEAVPGHHHQIALAMEQGEMPNFRRYGGYTAFIEGWGLYAESLGDELGLYDDPYSKFGQLTYEMWRAVRLVVDTGMHAFRWDRQKAIDFFLENAAKSELDITNEIDRYIAWPGQALAYKIGELKIKELRARARRELGDRFDLRQFHDAVLLSGAVPLDTLERQVSDWIDQ